MQLTIEHLAKHLPFGLKFIPTHYNKNNKADVLYYLSRISNNDDEEFGVNGYTSKYIKPSLFPLLAITKEIEIAGEKFVPIQELKIVDQWAGEFIEDVIMGFVEVIIYNRLLSWHIDVDCLIGKGLAVDATLNNPYK